MSALIALGNAATQSTNDIKYMVSTRKSLSVDLVLPFSIVCFISLLAHSAYHVYHQYPITTYINTRGKFEKI